MTTRVRIIGAGRAGGSFAAALQRHGYEVDGPLGRDVETRDAAASVDLLLICVPDAAIEVVAASISPNPECVVAHVSGSLGLDVLASHPVVAALHPLVSLPNAEIGAERLEDHAWFGVAGDTLVEQVVADFGGRCFPVADADRALYHAAACIASNHLVALLGQVERIGAAANVPFEAYIDLVRGTVDNVATLGPRSALTGPAARGDIATIERHRAALGELESHELPAYDVLVAEATRLAGREA